MRYDKIVRNKQILFLLSLLVGLTLVLLSPQHANAKEVECTINPSSISTVSLDNSNSYTIFLNSDNVFLGTASKPAIYEVDISDEEHASSCKGGGTGNCSAEVQAVEVSNTNQLRFQTKINDRYKVSGNVVFQIELQGNTSPNNCAPIKVPTYENPLRGFCAEGDHSISKNSNGEVVITAPTNKTDAPLRSTDTFHVSLVSCDDLNAVSCTGTPIKEWGGGHGSCLTGSQLATGFNTGVASQNGVKYTAYIYNCGGVAGPLGAVGEFEICRFSANSSNGQISQVNNPGETTCPYCPENTTWVQSTRKCKDKSGGDHDPLYDAPCGNGTVCQEGNTANSQTQTKSICSPLGNPVPKQGSEFIRNDLCPASKIKDGKCTAIPSGLGVDLPTNVGGLVNKLLGIFLGVVGGLAILIIIFSGYRLMTSQGNPEKIQGARETLTSAIVGFLFVIFSLVILQVIGYNILSIPGFGK